MRDHRGRSPAPRAIAKAVGSFRREIEPATSLASIETVWEEAVGAGIAAVASPVTERDGILTVECDSSVWAEELTLMEPKIRSRLASLLADEPPSRIRFRSR